jgi:hypothetical protein
MNPSNREIEASRVMCLLDELAGIPFNDKEWEGYHDEVYCQQYDLDALVATLCEKIRNIDVSKYSLEMQLWARNHKEADEKRIKRELQEKKSEEEIKVALSKLTPHERDLLGLE